MHLNLIMAHPLIALGAILIGLTLPAAWGKRSVKRFAVALLVAVFGVVLPLFIFFFSAFLVPEWKGGCDHGWMDCFYLGKLALTPLVLWATGALYVLENRMAQSVNHSIVLGLFTGAIVASVCFVFGLATTVSQPSGIMFWLLVPFYIAVWHGVRAAQWMRNSGFGPRSYLLTACGSIPFWIGSMIWSRRIYESLPNNPPECFVVTAAARGHESIVGPFFEINHGSRLRRANRQLITLWQFEALWRDCAPLSHALFRRAYNRLGPVVARRITSPGMADLAHLAIKPVELLAALAVKGAAGGKRKTSP
jgi:hypothetical protein